jgi:hypothetical protein
VIKGVKEKFLMQKFQARDKGGEEKISYAKVSGA